MSVTTKASARWEGDLRGGKGTMRLPSGAFEGPYTYRSRFEVGASREEGTNPEELIAAALSGCFAMYLASVLSKDGHTPESVEAEAAVVMEPGKGIASGNITVAVKAPGLDDATLQAKAREAARDCPVSKALAGFEKTVEARLA
ncbi:MAG TPA: OsmC family peroxiredoxin [Trueperaceae bacterium]|jgi:osmotically inducible protein OsmC